MFRFTTSAVASVPTPLETGITPIPPLKLARVSSAMTEGAKNPTSPVPTKTLISAHMISFEGFILIPLVERFAQLPHGVPYSSYEYTMDQPLQESPFPSRDHQPCSVVVFPLLPQLS